MTYSASGGSRWKWSHLSDSTTQTFWLTRGRETQEKCSNSGQAMPSKEHSSGRWTRFAALSSSRNNWPSVFMCSRRTDITSSRRDSRQSTLGLMSSQRFSLLSKENGTRTEWCITSRRFTFTRLSILYSWVSRRLGAMIDSSGWSLWLSWGQETRTISRTASKPFKIGNS